MNIDILKNEIQQVVDKVASWAISPQFYAQAVAIVVAVALAWIITIVLKKQITVLREEPQSGPFYGLRKGLNACRDLLFPIFLVLCLGAAIEAAIASVDQAWLIRIAQGVGVVFLLYSIITRFIENPFINSLFRWVGIPIATLHVFGWLDDTVQYLDTVAIEVGNIKISAYALARLAIFGSILFWLGRLSNVAGQKAIRNKAPFDVRTREVFAKLFEIALFIAIFLLLLNIIGLDLTALAVFGGALGVGLGFGLQQIASNFISGIIILLDRSISVGDYIELEDGKTGILRELNMRSSSLETFDGKIIVVPNEKFITSEFTNWTHNGTLQRYELEFSVAYNADIPRVPEIIIAAIRKHPQVLEKPEAPDCEIREFGESGILFGIEYWMDGIDDGENRVDADLLMIIWETLKESKIDIPFPQREVRIIGDTPVQ